MDEYGFRLTKDQRKDMAQIIGSDSEKNWNHDKDPAIDGRCFPKLLNNKETRKRSKTKRDDIKKKDLQQK